MKRRHNSQNQYDNIRAGSKLYLKERKKKIIKPRRKYFIKNKRK